MVTRINEEHIREELLKAYDMEALEILYQFLKWKGAKSFMRLRWKTMKEPEGERLRYLQEFFMGLLPEKTSLDLSMELLPIFTPDERQVLRSNFPPTDNVHYINKYNAEEYYREQRRERMFSSPGPYSQAGP